MRESWGTRASGERGGGEEGSERASERQASDLPLSCACVCPRTAVGEDVFRVAVTEKEGNKKGAFRSTSGLG